MRGTTRSHCLAAIAFALVLTSAGATAATVFPTENPVVLSGALDDRVQLEQGWRYHPGDDPSWADPGLDDSAWEVASSTLPISDDPASGWPGIGWFRRQLELGEGMPATALGLRPMHLGASEVYLDGRLVARFGVVSADPAIERPMYANDFVGIALEPGCSHLIAVRYSNARGNLTSWTQRGFALNLRSVASAAASYHRWGYLLLTSSAAFGGAFTALAVLHLLLFAFHPASREHVFFAAFCVAIAGSFAMRISVQLTTDLITRLALFRPHLALNVLAVLLGLALVHAVVRRRPQWPTWLVGAGGLVLVSWVWSWTAFRSLVPIYVFLLIGYLEMLRVAAVAAWRREVEIWIVVVPFVLLAGVTVVDTTGRLFGRDLGLDLLRNVVLAVLALAFSVFISRRAARTSRELERRLIEVRELSERALEQERRAVHQEAERKLLEAENLRRTYELEQARRLQVAMLPHTLPSIAGFELAFRMVTATEVGGDYVDLKTSDTAPTLLAVGDATSHGLQAGMVVAVAKSLFQGVDPGGGPLAALERVGAGLHGMHERHASMAMAVIEVTPGRLRLASAGMPPVLVLRRASGEVEEVLLPGVPLGTLSDATYDLEEIVLGPGDTVLVTSDGVAEAERPCGEPFGYARIAGELRNLKGRPAQEIVDGLLAVAEAHLDGRPPQDDITLLALVVT